MQDARVLLCCILHSCILNPLLGSPLLLRFSTSAVIPRLLAQPKIGSSSRRVLGKGKWTSSSRMVVSSMVAPYSVWRNSTQSWTTSSGALRAGGDQDGFDPFEPFGLDFGDAVDQMGMRAETVADFGESQAVRAVLTAENEHQVGRRRQGGTASWRFWVA